MDKKKRKKFFTKAKLIRGARGSISILLCLLLTPFLTIGLSLMEYARYQQIIEVAGEIIDLLGVSTLADYDSYIQDRFGLMAVTQETPLGTGAQDLVTLNTKVTGTQLTASSTSVSGLGGTTLNSNDVLLVQVRDLGELTVPTTVLMEDLKLQEVFNFLNDLDGLNNAMNTVNKLADATDAVTGAVEAVQKLKDDLATAKTAVQNVPTKCRELADKMSDLVKKLGDAGITLPQNATPEQIASAVNSFKDTYLNDIKGVYNLAAEVKQAFETAKQSVEALKGDVTTIQSKLQAAKDAISAIGSTGGEPDKVTEATVTNLEDVLDEMEDVVNGTLKNLKDTLVQRAKQALQEAEDALLEDMGLTVVLPNYTAFFSLVGDPPDLSDEAKAIIEDFLKMAYNVYQENHSAQDVLGAIKNYFVTNFVPSVNDINFDNIASQLGDILSRAGGDLQSEGQSQLKDMLDKLIKLLEKLFHLTVMYNPGLNATNVHLEVSGAAGAAQGFVDAVDTMISSAKDFINGLGSLNLVKALKAVATFLKALGTLVSAVIQGIADKITGIANAVSGGWKSLYERFIVTGYLAHNLPCRTDAPPKLVGNLEKVDLNNSGITGFAYNDIARGPGTFKGAEMEYIYSGSNSETGNQTFVFWDLFFLRLLIDIPSVMSNGEVSALAASATIASWAVYLIYIIIEPFLDTLLLVNGVKVDIYKTYCWMTASKVGEFVTKLTEAATDCDDIANEIQGFVNDKVGASPGGGDTGMWPMSYQNYLLLMTAVFVSTDVQMTRFRNIIYMETNKHYEDNGHADTFKLDKAYVAVNLEGTFQMDPFFDLGSASGGGPLSPEFTVRRTVSY